MAATDNVGVLRFGQEYWVVLNAPPGLDLTRAQAEPCVVARFPFAGRDSRRNPEALAARADAMRFARGYFRTH